MKLSSDRTVVRYGPQWHYGKALSQNKVRVFVVRWGSNLVQGTLRRVTADNLLKRVTDDDRSRSWTFLEEQKRQMKYQS